MLYNLPKASPALAIERAHDSKAFSDMRTNQANHQKQKDRDVVKPDECRVGVERGQVEMRSRSQWAESQSWN